MTEEMPVAGPGEAGHAEDLDAIAEILDELADRHSNAREAESLCTERKEGPGY